MRPLNGWRSSSCGPHDLGDGGHDCFLEGRVDSPPVCPGFAVFVPKALEAAEAYNMLQASELDAVWSKPLTPNQSEILRVYGRATSQAEDWRLEQLRQRSG